MPDIGGEAQLLEQADHRVAKVRLPPAPSQPSDGGAGVMVAMPVLALQEMHQSEPRHVAARILTERRVRLHMAYAVHEALRVQREYQPDRPEPEERRRPEVQTAEIRQSENCGLERLPDSIPKPIEVRAIARNRRCLCLP